MAISDFFNPNHLLGRAVWVLLTLSLLTAPMGCFMIWRRLSYFGATLAHSALLGAILGLLTGIGVLAGVLSFSVLIALGLSYWLSHRHLPMDTILGIIAHLTLAIGVIGISLMDNLRIDLMAYLLGDVLAVSSSMFYVMVGFTGLFLAVIAIYWKGFINLCVQPDIAEVEGYPVKRLELIFTITMALTISFGMISIGILLIIAMLIIPAASARFFSSSLKQMVFLAWLFAVLSILAGIALSYWLNLPAGATIVTIEGLLFFLSGFGAQLLSKST